MNGFVAIVLICLNTVPWNACNEETASDARSRRVESGSGCTAAWEELIARSPLFGQLGSTAYMKLLCEPLAPTGGTEER